MASADRGMPNDQPHRRISVLFDLFVLNQHVRAILARTMEGTGLRPDEYAMYSLVFEVGSITPTEMARLLAIPPTTISDYVRQMLGRGHARRVSNPRDSRSSLISLTRSGLAAHRLASAGFEQAIGRIMALIDHPLDDVARALHALDEATLAALADLDAVDRRAAGAS